MSRPLTDSEALIAALAEKPGEAGPSEVLEPERLLDYLAGRLSPEEEESLGRRLAADPEAARALLDLADLEAAGVAAETARERPREIGIQAAWRDLEKRLPPAVVPPARRPKALWATSALAALLLVAVVRQRVENSSLKRQLSQAVPLVTLALTSLRAEGEQTIALSPDQPFRLVLNPEADCPVYSVKIQGPGADGSQALKNQKADDQGRLDFLLRGMPGEYEVTLSGCEPNQEPEKHRFRIVPLAG